MKYSRSFVNILLKNLLTPFNFILFIGFVIVCLTGQYIDALFGIVLILNTIIGVALEYKAARMLKNLRVLSGSKQTIIRDGKNIEIQYSEIQKNDILLLKSGDEISVDGVLLDNSYIEIDESNITGEAEPIVKNKNSKILSGCVVISGYNRLLATSTWEDSFSGKLEKKASVFSLSKSVIRIEINKLLKILCAFVFPLMFLLFFSEFKGFHLSYYNIFHTIIGKLAVTHSVAGMVGMIPEGLVLLTSVNFAISAIILAKKKVLTQELPAIEVLSRVDTLCIDKTGTITTGNLKIKKIKYFIEEDLAKRVLHKFGTQIDANKTAQVFKSIEADDIDISKYTPFSSARKYSSIVIGKTEYILGSPDNLLNNMEKTKYKKYLSDDRVLVLGVKGKTNFKVYSIICIEDEIRKNAKKTIQYFYKNNVDIKIISGDNLNTILKIAKEVGIKIKNTIDLSKKSITSQNFNDISIIARAKPDEKQKIIEYLQNENNIVAMTGDGVNDVLALKKADLAISMPNGANVVKSISQLVLSDGAFSALPQIVLEGRRIISNMARSAILFLIKTTFAILTALIVVVFSVKYPYLPRHLTLVSVWAIGVPGFLISIEPNYEKFKQKFLKTVLLKAMPLGIINGGLALISYFAIKPKFNSSNATVILLFLGLYALFFIVFPINKYKCFVLLLCISGAIFCITVMKDFFQLSSIQYFYVFIFVGIGILLHTVFNNAIKKMYNNRI